MNQFNQLVKSVWPGLLLVVGIAWLATVIAELGFIKNSVGFSSLLIAILVGILVASVYHLPEFFKPGIGVAQKPILRWAVAGLGFRLMLSELMALGWQTLLIVIVAVSTGFFSLLILAKLFGLNQKLGFLLATGGSICGASAIAAADTVVQSEGKDAAIGLGIVTLFGTVGIFLFPWLREFAGWSDMAYGVLCGSTLHETAQVVAAASSGSEHVVEIATVVKLARIVFLAPIVFGLGVWLSKSSDQRTAKVPLVPWFLVLFLIFAIVNSFADPAMMGAAKEWINPVVKFLLVTGMAGIGLQTGFKDIKNAGWKAVAASLFQWIFMILVTLGMISLLQIS